LTAEKSATFNGHLGLEIRKLQNQRHAALKGFLLLEVRFEELFQASATAKMAN